MTHGNSLTLPLALTDAPMTETVTVAVAVTAAVTVIVTELS